MMVNAAKARCLIQSQEYARAFSQIVDFGGQKHYHTTDVIVQSRPISMGSAVHPCSDALIVDRKFVGSEYDSATI